MHVFDYLHIVQFVQYMTNRIVQFLQYMTHGKMLFKYKFRRSRILYDYDFPVNDEKIPSKTKLKKTDKIMVVVVNHLRLIIFIIWWIIEMKIEIEIPMKYFFTII